MEYDDFLDFEEKDIVTIMNKDGIKEFLSDVTFPMYFLDFEAITNSKQWMYNHGLDLDQQLSSFSILRIDSIDDDETKIKHYNFVGGPTDYEVMAKKLTDFYKDNGTVIVWGRDLEVRGIAKLMKASPESYNKKFAQMISNMTDIQQLFYEGSFMRIEPYGKSSLDAVARAYNVYTGARIKDGKKAHYILEHALKSGITESHMNNICRRIEEYNNSDVINMKRIMVEILNSI